MANEEDTVTVGQDLLKLELGAPPKGSDKLQAGQEPKAPAPDDQPSSSDPEPKKEEKSDLDREPPSSDKKSEPPRRENKPDSPPKESSGPKDPSLQPHESRKPEPKSSASASMGNREERRVGLRGLIGMIRLKASTGQDESHAITYF